MANSRVTGCLYEYELVGALADDPMLGIKYVGQNCGPSLPPDEALVDRHKKHIREAKSCPNKPISRFINSYGEAALRGPIPVKTPKGKRIEVMMFLDEQEDKRIMELGGPWRDGSHGNTQTLNKKRGGQGDPFTVLCGLAGRKLKADLASHCCEHGRQRSRCTDPACIEQRDLRRQLAAQFMCAAPPPAAHARRPAAHLTPPSQPSSSKRPAPSKRAREESENDESDEDEDVRLGIPVVRASHGASRSEQRVLPILQA